MGAKNRTQEPASRLKVQQLSGNYISLNFTITTPLVINRTPTHFPPDISFSFLFCFAICSWTILGAYFCLVTESEFRLWIHRRIAGLGPPFSPVATTAKILRKWPSNTSVSR